MFVSLVRTLFHPHCNIVQRIKTHRFNIFQPLENQNQTTSSCVGTNRNRRVISLTETNLCVFPGAIYLPIDLGRTRCIATIVQQIDVSKRMNDVWIERTRNGTWKNGALCTKTHRSNRHAIERRYVNVCSHRTVNREIAWTPPWLPCSAPPTRITYQPGSPNGM